MSKNYKSHPEVMGIIFIAPAMIYLFIVIVYPLITIIPSSFQEYVTSSRSFIFVGLKQYQRLLSDRVFWTSIKTTFIFTVIMVIQHLVLGLAVASLLNARWFSIRLRNFFRGIILLPWIFSPAASALLWGILYHPRGLLTYLTQQFLHMRIGFLSDPRWALFSVLLVNAWNYAPFCIIILLGGLQSIPDSLYEAAKVDGSNWIESFLYITLPQMKFIITTLAVIIFITTFVHFDLVWIMTGGGPLRSTYLISFYLYNKGMLTYKFGYASAVSVVMAFFISIFVVINLILYSRKGEI